MKYNENGYDHKQQKKNKIKLFSFNLEYRINILKLAQNLIIDTQSYILFNVK